MNDLPKEVSSGEIKIGDLTIRVVRLDNGQRVIPAEDFEKFLKALEGVNDPQANK